MKLSSLLIGVGVLGVLAAGIWYFTRPAPPPADDPRVGQPVLATDGPADWAALELAKDDGTRVRLEAGPHGWIVQESYPLPVDFPKLSRLIQSLQDMTVERFVTQQAERLERLNLGQQSITAFDAVGEAVFRLELGDTPSQGGGYFATLGDEAAYRLSGNLWLDTLPNNWPDKTPIAWEIDELARATLATLDADAPLSLIAYVEGATSSWTLADGAEDSRLRVDEANSVLNTLRNLRYLEARPAQDAEVVEAMSFAHTFRLEHTGGAQITVTIGRRPEMPAAPDWLDATALAMEPADVLDDKLTTDAPDDEPEMRPAGLVFARYAFVGLDNDPWAAAVDGIAFELSSASFDRLLVSRDRLVERVEPEAAGPTAGTGE